MTKNRFTLVLLFVFLALAPISLEQAQAMSTWVSDVNDDANPYSRTASCKTFVDAIWKTTSGGEIVSINRGGFGTLTITKSFHLRVSGVGDDANLLRHTALYKRWNSEGEISTLGQVGLGIIMKKDMTLEGDGAFASILNSDFYGIDVNDTTCVGGSNTQHGPTAALSRHKKISSSWRNEAPVGISDFNSGFGGDFF